MCDSCKFRNTYICPKYLDDCTEQDILDCIVNSELSDVDKDIEEWLHPNISGGFNDN